MITHTWVNISDQTNSTSISVYSDICRLVTEMYTVEIFRNPFDINAGIYVVGDTELDASVNWLLGTIRNIEGQVAKKKYYNPLTHKSRAKSLYKSKLINKVISKYKSQPLKPKDYLEERKIDEYIKQTPLFNNLKRFVWKG